MFQHGFYLCNHWKHVASLGAIQTSFELRRFARRIESVPKIGRSASCRLRRLQHHRQRSKGIFCRGICWISGTPILRPLSPTSAPRPRAAWLKLARWPLRSKTFLTHFIRSGGLALGVAFFRRLVYMCLQSCTTVWKCFLATLAKPGFQSHCSCTAMGKSRRPRRTCM